MISGLSPMSLIFEPTILDDGAASATRSTFLIAAVPV
jgi:hypothetical protein